MTRHTCCLVAAIPLLVLFAGALHTSLHAEDEAEPAVAKVVTEITNTEGGDRLLIQRMQFDAPVAEVYAAYTTADGWMAWAVPQAKIDLRVGGEILTRYDTTGELGAAGTIRLHVLGHAPNELLILQAEPAPELAGRASRGCRSPAQRPRLPQAHARSLRAHLLRHRLPRQRGLRPTPPLLRQRQPSRTREAPRLRRRRNARVPRPLNRHGSWEEQAAPAAFEPPGAMQSVWPEVKNPRARWRSSGKRWSGREDSNHVDPHGGSTSNWARLAGGEESSSRSGGRAGRDGRGERIRTTWIRTADPPATGPVWPEVKNPRAAVAAEREEMVGARGFEPRGSARRIHQQLGPFGRR